MGTVRIPNKVVPEKLKVYNHVLRRLKGSGEDRLPGFDEEELWAHFNRLPSKYAVDMINVDRAEDVLSHMRLLQQNIPSFHVRLVKVLPAAAIQEEEHTSGVMHEITFSAYDRPNLLSNLTFLLSEIGLNVQEAHVFSTNDGFSLDVFLVQGCPSQETEKLKQRLEKEIQKLKSNHEDHQTSTNFPLAQIKIPSDGTDPWEIDIKRLNLVKKVASGSYTHLYRGTYCSQDVAIKILNPEHVNVDMQNEFAQEVFIMRKVRHKNVVQFIGACTKPPSLSVVTEFMSGGSVYDHLHKHKRVFKLPAILRAATHVSKGMNYLHQNNIIHRDLKTANLLMGENDIVKVADFGVAKIKCQSAGVMTAETGTYRWMAPEVVEHKPYDHKADVYSFAIVLWELITGKVPYGLLTPLQAAVGVVQKDLRPTIPKNTNANLVDLLRRCWQKDPTLRPEFSEILEILQSIAKEVESEQDGQRYKDKKASGAGFFSVFKRG